MLGKRICHLYNSQGLVCLLSSEGVFSQLQQYTTLTITPARLVHGILFMALEFLYLHPDRDCSGLLQPALALISKSDRHNKRFVLARSLHQHPFCCTRSSMIHHKTKDQLVWVTSSSSHEYYKKNISTKLARNDCLYYTFVITGWSI